MSRIKKTEGRRLKPNDGVSTAGRGVKAEREPSRHQRNASRRGIASKRSRQRLEDAFREMDGEQE
jgi:hypothetical protein